MFATDAFMFSCAEMASIFEDNSVRKDAAFADEDGISYGHIAP